MSESAGREAERRRLQLEFSPEVYEELARMRDEYDAQSFAELVGNSLRIYDWFKKQQSEGYEIGLIKNGKVEKIVELVR